MSYDPSYRNLSSIMKKGMELRKKSEMYKKRNESIDLPNLITREVYQNEELIVEIMCTSYIDIKRMIITNTIKRILKELEITRAPSRNVLSEMLQNQHPF